MNNSKTVTLTPRELDLIMSALLNYGILKHLLKPELKELVTKLNKVGE